MALQLLQEGNYPAATQLCLECQSAIEMYKQYSCVRYDTYFSECATISLRFGWEIV